MKIKVRPNKREGGITLIALIIMIILMIILAAVAVRGLTGDEGIVISATKIVDEYTYAQYKEKIEQIVQGKIFKDALKGEETTLKGIAEELSKEDWIKSAVIGVNEITVTTKEGYIYQVYYDEYTGELKINGAGQENGLSVPVLSIKYDKEAGTIEATASCEDGIASIELIYKGEVKDKTEGKGAKTVTGTYKNIRQTGVYEIKATSSRGKVKYGYVSVKDTGTSSGLKAPTIEIISGTKGKNDWYRGEVKVRIEGQGTGGEILKYRIVREGAGEEIPVGSLTKELTINNLGLTRIIAWVENTAGDKKSTYSYQNVKIDNVAPLVPKVEVIEGKEGNEVSRTAGTTGTGANTNKWYITDIKLKIIAEDENSGIDSYEYTIIDTQANKKIIDRQKIQGSSKEIEIKTDGIYEIKVQAIDKAGNQGVEGTKIIYKDSTKPNEFIPTITAETPKGFTVIAYTDDNLSGIDKYKYYIDGEMVYEGLDKKHEVAGEPNTAYGVKVEAHDKAGNIQIGTATGAYTGAEDTTPPVVIVTKGQVTTNSIQVYVTATDQGSGLASEPEYTYYIKKSNEPEYRKVAENIKDTTYSYEGLEQGIEYDIKVEVEDGAGNIGSGAIRIITTEKMPDGAGEGAIIFEEGPWQNYKKNVRIATTYSKYQIQYKVVKDGQQETSINWTTIPNKGEGTNVTNLDHKDKVYARLWDGTNAGTNKEKEIKDETAPTIGIAKGNTTTSTIEIRVTSAEDKEWGMPEEPIYTYYYKKQGASEYKKAQETKETSYTYQGLENNEKYDIKVEVKDKAGNIGQASMTGEQGTGITTDKIPDGTIEGAINFSQVTWENGTAKVTISTNQPNYYIQYKIVPQGKTENDIANWTTATNKGQSIQATGMKHKDKLIARLWDGTSGGSKKEIEILGEFTVTYNYAENGGTTATVTSKKIITGQAVDLSITATKGGWEFVGWNTNKDATDKLTTLTMPTNDITLYAIYKKTITATYKTYNNQTNTETKTIYNKAQTANFTLPAISNATEGGNTYTGRGWSEQDTANATVTNAGTQKTINANKTYYASYQTQIETTFYYNSNGTSGSLTASTAKPKTTRQMNYAGTKIDETLEVPTAVTDSKGKYRSNYRGVASAVNTTTLTTTITPGSTYYAVYSSQVNIYAPTSTTAAGNNVRYRNEYFTSNTAMATKLGTTNTATTDSAVNSYDSNYSVYGYANSSSTNTRDYETISTLATSDKTTSYVILYKTGTATFWYNNSSTSGTLDAKSTTGSATQRVRCTSTTKAETSNDTIQVPTAVTGSKGKYRANYRGIAANTDTTTLATTITPGSTYYAVYSSQVNIYAPTSTTAAGNNVRYRNEYFTSTSAMATKLGTSNTATTDSAVSAGVSGYSVYGYANSASTNTRDYETISNLATSDKTTSYVILYKSGNATFYYNSSSTSGTLIASTATVSGTQRIRCTGTSTAGTSHDKVTVPTVVTGSKGKYRSAYHGVASEVNTMASTINQRAGLTYYAIYSTALTIYYPTAKSGSNTVSTTYIKLRNEYFTNNSTMKAVIADDITNTVNTTLTSTIADTTFFGLTDRVSYTRRCLFDSTSC